MLKLLLGHWNKRRHHTPSSSHLEKLPLPYDLPPVNRINPLYEEATDSDDCSNLATVEDLSSGEISTAGLQFADIEPPSGTNNSLKRTHKHSVETTDELPATWEDEEPPHPPIGSPRNIPPTGHSSVERPPTTSPDNLNMAPQSEDSSADSEKPPQKPVLIQERAKSIADLIRQFQTSENKRPLASLHKERPLQPISETSAEVASFSRQNGNAGVTTVASSGGEHTKDGSVLAPVGERKFKKNAPGSRTKAYDTRGSGKPEFKVQNGDEVKASGGRDTSSRSEVKVPKSKLHETKTESSNVLTNALHSATSDGRSPVRSADTKETINKQIGDWLEATVPKTKLFVPKQEDVMSSDTKCKTVDTGHLTRKESAGRTDTEVAAEVKAKLIEKRDPGGRSDSVQAEPDQKESSFAPQKPETPKQTRSYAGAQATGTKAIQSALPTVSSKMDAGTEALQLETTRKMTSEDSGVTRGDQVSSDGHGSELGAEASPRKATHPPSPDKARETRKYTRHGSRACKHCGTSKRPHQKGQAKGTCDDYYMKVIKDGRVPRRQHRPDSWASDMSWDEYWDRGYGPALCNDCGHFIHPRSRFGTIRTVAGDPGTWGRENPGCGCRNCWEMSYLDRLRKNLGRGSVRSRYGGSVLCTCCRDGPLFGNDRKVKFAEKLPPDARGVHPGSSANEHAHPSNGSVSKGSESSLTFNLSESSPHEAEDGASETSQKDKGTSLKTEGSSPLLQNLAFGTCKPKGKGHHHNHGDKPTSERQWEEWKKKDDEFVNEAYEHDLQQAILLSKIDYEEKKDLYEIVKKDDHRSGSQNLKKKKKSSQKKEKPSAMSLEEFQNLLPSQIDSGMCMRGDQTNDTASTKSQLPLPNEANFFEKIEEDAEKIILREQRHEAYKKVEPFMEEQVRSLHHQEEIEKKDKQISYLVEQVDKLKKELKTVKDRNKMFCGILSQGEMKEKAEILIQMEELIAVKDELTQQVAELHAALEQERSKVHSLQTSLKKQQGSKKEAREAK